MRQLAHYSVHEKIGQGGMGEVYRAQDTRLRRDVAIKVLPDAFVQDPERLGRFRREAQLLASLNHPHVAAVHGLEEDQGTHFIVLELVAGEDLAQRLARGPLPLPEAVAIALQIATAVEAAHELGIVHRDLKPSNVMLTPAGEVKVLDFGLAKAVQGEMSDSSLDLGQSPTLTSPVAMTAANMILGTAAYMAPEQARGKRVDRRADIWAFGVLLWEMLTGKPLFQGETVSDTLAAVLREDPDADRLPRATPPYLHRLLGRCLTRDPRLRLQDMGEARIALAAGETGAMVPEAGGRRLPLVPMAAVALGCLLIGGMLGFLLGPPAADPAPAQPRLISLDVGPGDAPPADATISPDGTRIAYIRDRSIWVRDLDRLEPRHLDRTEDVIDLFWSPDGARIGYLTVDRVMTVDPVGGDPVVVAATRGMLAEDTGSGGHWSREHGILFAEGADHVFRVSDRGGEPTVFAAADTSIEVDLHEPFELPDGGLLAVSHRHDEMGLGALEMVYGDERVRVVETPGSRLFRPTWSAATGHVLYERQEGNPGVWAVPWDLSGRRAVAEPFLVLPGGLYPSVADDGTLVAVLGQTIRDVQLVETDRSGTVRRRLGPARPLALDFSLSPDGRTLAFMSVAGDQEDIWVRDLERGTENRLTFSGGPKAALQWSPDGQRLSFAIGNSASNMHALVQPLDGSAPAETLASRSAGGAFVTGSQDMLFDIETPQTSWDIFVGSSEPGGELRPLVREPGWQYAGAVSPDGKYVAYMSRETGEDQVFLRRYPDGRGKWQVSVEGGCWPRWTAAGDRLLYARDDDIVEVAVQTSDPPVLGRPTVVFSRPAAGIQMGNGWSPGFAVSADGERFYFAQAGDAEAASRITMVLYENWAAGPLD